MQPDRFRLAVVLVLSGLLVVVSIGFGGGPLAEEPDPEELILDAVESTNNESIEGVRTEVIQRPDEYERITVEVIERPPAQSRIEVIEAIETDAGSDLTVVNGSTMWQYFAEERRAVRLQRDRQWGSDSRTVVETTRNLLDEYDVSYSGTATVEDREAHVVKLTPPDDDAIGLSLGINAGDTEYEFEIQEVAQESWFVTQETWWIDTETAYPIKQRVEWTDQSEDVTTTTIREYSELTIDPQIEDQTFGFEPPGDIEVAEPKLPEMERHASRAGAESVVPFDLPEPTLPSGYEFEQATVQRFDGAEGVVLTYLKGGDTLTVQVSEGESLVEKNRVVETDVGVVEGSLLAIGDRTDLAWECDGLSYRLSGVPDVDILEEIAGSIGCYSPSDSSSTAPGSAGDTVPTLPGPGKLPGE